MRVRGVSRYSVSPSSAAAMPTCSGVAPGTTRSWPRPPGSTWWPRRCERLAQVVGVRASARRSRPRASPPPSTSSSDPRARSSPARSPRRRRPPARPRPAGGSTRARCGPPRPSAASARAASGCRRGRGRWSARPGSARRVADHRRRDRQPLAHALRVALDAPLLGAAQLDQVDQLVDPRASGGRRRRPGRAGGRGPSGPGWNDVSSSIAPTRPVGSSSRS